MRSLVYAASFAADAAEPDKLKLKLDSGCAAKAMACAKLLGARADFSRNSAGEKAAAQKVETFCKLHELVGDVVRVPTADQPERAEAILATLVRAWA